ncbi:hypothetical protein DV451_001976 [Geotrichum candidum]|uniref:amidase n=1 Tax=Geotrichum candidum TaxID=1173061 RepID=A0A9P5KUK8_GEOCN|nr:hypothetical protein DV451_001976 [Geotrichum candidum]
MTAPEKAQWQINAEKAQAYREASIQEVAKLFPSPEDGNKFLTGAFPNPLPTNVTPLTKEYLTPLDYAIIETDPLVLLKDLASKKYSAVQVIGAYIRAGVLGQRLLNNVTEFLPAMALERAQFLDDYLAKNGKTIGPLHGLPFSLKDHIALQGHRNNFSLTALVDNVTDHTSVIAEIIRDAGAVYYQRTVQPQFLMHLESSSNVYGVAKNPFNTTLTCGGSSGGEAAALGFHSSAIGLGTDIGGSIRGPASMQGVYGFKPSVGRLPVGDTFMTEGNSSSILGAIGPMGRTLAIVDLVTKVILDERPWKVRPELIAKPWAPEAVLADKKKLRVGVLHSDGVVNPQPPVARALKEVESKLKAAGKVGDIELEIVPFTPYNHDEAWRIISSLYFEDGGVGSISLLEETGEPMMELTKFIMTENENVRPLNLADLWALNAKKHAYRNAYTAHWKASGIGFLIAPAGPGAAQPHGTTRYWGYTSQWNLLDYPGVVFPVTTVDPEKDAPFPAAEYTPLNATDKDYFERYTPETYADAPIALQIVGHHSEDEEVIEYLKLVEQVLAN